MRDLMPKLKAAGGQGIVEYPLNKIVVYVGRRGSWLGGFSGLKSMLRIVESTNRRAVRALLAPERVRDAATDKRVARIVGDVRTGGDAALLRYAQALDRLDGPIEIGTDEMRAAARTVDASVRRAIRDAARNIRIVARRQVPRGWRVRVAPGVSVEQRIIPLDRVGCYVPGGRYPLPSSLLMTAIPADAAGVKDVIAVCPQTRTGGHGGRARGRRVPPVPHRRRARHRRDGVRHSDRAARGQDRRPGQSMGGRRQGADRLGLRHRLLRGPDRDRDRVDTRTGRVGRRRPHCPGRT